MSLQCIRSAISRTYVELNGFLPEGKPGDVMSSTTDYTGNTFNVTYSGVATHYMPSEEDDTTAHVCAPTITPGT